MTTHIDAYSILAAHAIIYQDIDEPIFVRVSICHGDDPIFTVAARFPHKSNPEAVIKEFLDYIDWDVEIIRNRDCWSIVFGCASSQLTRSEREYFLLVGR